MLPAFFIGILAVQPSETWTHAASQSSAFSFAFPLALAAGVQTVSLAQRRLACFVRESRFWGSLFIVKGQIESMLLGIGKYKDTGKILPETLREVENMERLVGEILAISKMEMDGLTRREPVFLGELVSQVTEALLPLAQERRITVHTQCSGEAVVSGSPSLLEKAIHNIVGNAIRHSPEGARVTIQLTPTALTVTNTGVSIPREDLPVLFTPFYRVEKSRNKSTGGSGLGLYLVKTIFQLHGFSYRLENVTGGVAFTVGFEKCLPPPQRETKTK